jgi:hypothetical protein
MTALTSATEPSDAGYFSHLDREAAKEEAQEEFIKKFLFITDSVDSV